MCTYITASTPIVGSGKGVADWMRLNKATVYYDHPADAPFDHALIIDFVDEAKGPGARVAVELSAGSAHDLMKAIQEALGTPEAQHDLAQQAKVGDHTHDQA